MFNFEIDSATRQLNERRITFKKSHGYVSPDKIQDRHTLILAGFKKTAGNEVWFDALIDSDEFRKHFDTHTLVDWDDVCPAGTPAPSPLMDRFWNSFAT